jgi:hypothetical protein
MFDAQTVLAVNPTAIAIFSPWFPRGGDNAYFTLEVVAISSANMTVEVEVFHKTREDTGDGTQLGSAWDRTAVGREAAEFTGLKEMVRFKYTFTSASGTQWATFRMLQPVWFDTVATSA